MVFSLFSFIDTAGGLLLNMVPYYTLMKLLVLVWLQNPMTQGGQVVYENLIVPFHKKYNKQIELVKSAFENGFFALGNALNQGS